MAPLSLPAPQVPATPLTLTASNFSALPTTWCAPGKEIKLTNGRLLTDSSVVPNLNGNLSTIQMVYAYGADKPDRFDQGYAGVLQMQATYIHQWMLSQAGGTKTLRFLEGAPCGSQYLALSSVQLEQPIENYAPPNGSMSMVFDELRRRGILPAQGAVQGRNVAIVVDGNDSVLNSQGACTISAWGQGFGSPGANFSSWDPALNPNAKGGNVGGSYYRARVADLQQCLHASPLGIMHEIGHILGVVNADSIHSDGTGHCDDGLDVMCNGRAGGASTLSCSPLPVSASTGYIDSPWDCNHDDYFNPSGNIIGKNGQRIWNLYDAPFMCAASQAGNASACGETAPSGGAIALKYEQTGGPGFLGWPLASEFSIPGGAERDYQFGSIYWSPSNGAHWVATAGGVLTKYRALGGPGGAGFPVNDEYAIGNTGQGIDFVNNSIFYSTATGAHEVHGAIRDRYRALSGPYGLAGFPTSDEYVVPNGQANNFQGANFYWSATTGVRYVKGWIRSHYLALGGPNGWMALPTTDEYGIAGGQANDFQGQGATIYSSSAGAFEVHGSIKSRYVNSFGGPAGWLGFPRRDQYGVANGAASDFTAGSLWWTAATGSVFETHGAIDGQYKAMGGPSSALGLPKSDETAACRGGRYNSFQGGRITWSSTTGAHSTHGQIHAWWAAQGYECGGMGLPLNEEFSWSGAWRQDFQPGYYVSSTF
jgi:hypothetical protein